MVTDDSLHFSFEAVVLGSTFGACEQVVHGGTVCTATENAGTVAPREFIVDGGTTDEAQEGCAGGAFIRGAEDMISEVVCSVE